MEPALRTVIEESLGAGIQRAAGVGGGDTSTAHRLDLDDGRRVFAKSLQDAPGGFFVTEATGLRWLRDADAVPVPEVLAVGDAPAFLVLEWIEPGTGDASTERSFGRDLASLHRSGAPVFGREDRRPTGSRSLPNDPAPDWSSFYAERRLRPLAALAEQAGALDGTAVAGLRGVADRLDQLVGPPEAPARLHGDLWGGNRMVDATGRSWLVDPAAFGGHREFDLAMMRLFGGFGREAYDAYHEAFPLADGWQDRVQLHQLAPLVVHAVKFGGGYRSAASEAIARYA